MMRHSLQRRFTDGLTFMGWEKIIAAFEGAGPRFGGNGPFTPGNPNGSGARKGTTRRVFGAGRDCLLQISFPATALCSNLPIFEKFF
jgi:hypothetical protein